MSLFLLLSIAQNVSTEWLKFIYNSFATFLLKEAILKYIIRKVDNAMMRDSKELMAALKSIWLCACMLHLLKRAHIHIPKIIF